MSVRPCPEAAKPRQYLLHECRSPVLNACNPVSRLLGCWAFSLVLGGLETEAHARHAEVLPTLRAHFLVRALLQAVDA